MSKIQKCVTCDGSMEHRHKNAKTCSDTCLKKSKAEYARAFRGGGDPVCGANARVFPVNSGDDRQRENIPIDG